MVCRIFLFQENGKALFGLWRQTKFHKNGNRGVQEKEKCGMMRAEAEMRNNEGAKT